MKPFSSLAAETLAVCAIESSVIKNVKAVKNVFL
jgi:hypothetical protein